MAASEFYPRQPSSLPFGFFVQYCLIKPHKKYIVDDCYVSGEVFDYTSYAVTVGLSNTVQLRLSRYCPGMLGYPPAVFVSEAWAYVPGLMFFVLLYCLVALLFFLFRCNSDAPSTYVCQALRHEITKRGFNPLVRNYPPMTLTSS